MTAFDEPRPMNKFPPAPPVLLPSLSSLPSSLLSPCAVPPLASLPPASLIRTTLALLPQVHCLGMRGTCQSYIGKPPAAA